jgi:hypothetical protein
MPESLGNSASRYRSRGFDCRLIPTKVTGLSDYFAIFGTYFQASNTYWFRGHASKSWPLTPSALRYPTLEERNTALGLVAEFKRLVEFTLRRAPRHDEELKWIQIAQHYGLPTRLLDWTESATTALYFACSEPEKNGVVFIFNPIDLNRLRDQKRPRIFDAQSDSDLISPYLKLDGQRRQNGRHSTIAIKPVLNDSRIVVQKGVFTLHGNKEFSLTSKRIPSLVALPILKEYKNKLKNELAQIGVDEMTLFPDPEHTANQLKQNANL